MRRDRLCRPNSLLSRRQAGASEITFISAVALQRALLAGQGAEILLVPSLVSLLAIHVGITALQNSSMLCQNSQTSCCDGTEHGPGDQGRAERVWGQ